MNCGMAQKHGSLMIVGRTYRLAKKAICWSKSTAICQGIGINKKRLARFLKVNGFAPVTSTGVMKTGIFGFVGARMTC